MVYEVQSGSIYGIIRLKKNMTATEITNYLVNEYGECKHDAYAMSEAIMDMA